MKRGIIVLFAAVLVCLFESSALAWWNASFKRAAKVNGTFSTFGIISGMDKGGSTLKVDVYRAKTVSQLLFGYSVTFHAASKLDYSNCSTDKSAGECLDEAKKNVSAEDAFSKIRNGDLIVFSGHYDAGKDAFVITKLVKWVSKDK